jgi:hypothetical protein
MTSICDRLRLVTTNDNIRALRFYQRRGWRMAALHLDAVDAARKIKPEIPALVRSRHCDPSRDRIRDYVWRNRGVERRFPLFRNTIDGGIA